MDTDAVFSAITAAAHAASAGLPPSVGIASTILGGIVIGIIRAVRARRARRAAEEAKKQ